MTLDSASQYSESHGSRREDIVRTGGTVQRVEDNSAWVAVDSQAGCAGCSAKKDCGASSLLMGTPEIKMKNALGAQAGQRIEIGMRADAVVSASALLFLLPVALFFVGLAVGYWLAPMLGFASEQWSGMLFGLIGLGVASAVIYMVSLRLKKQPHYEPVMLRILENEKQVSCKL